MYASDLMIWLWTILFRAKSCQAYNVGSEEAISIADLAREVASIPHDAQDLPGLSSGGRGLPVEIARRPLAGVQADRYVPSTQRARKELGLTCSVPLREAIERTISWNRVAYAQELQSK
jgi:dTDP-glucose 4,6-dehydratase